MKKISKRHKLILGPRAFCPQCGYELKRVFGGGIGCESSLCVSGIVRDAWERGIKARDNDGRRKK